jgi:hypothetical protein
LNLTIRDITRGQPNKRKETGMKKLIFFMCVLGLVIVFSNSGVALNDGLPSTFGIRLDDDNYCNDFFLIIDMMDNNLYQCHGYEYGCGAYDRTLWGTAHIYGGMAYINFTCLDVSVGDYGAVATNCCWIDLGTRTGTDWWSYYYGSGGAPGYMGGTSPMTLVVGPNPLGEIEADSPDKSVR